MGAMGAMAPQQVRHPREGQGGGFAKQCFAPGEPEIDASVSVEVDPVSFAISRREQKSLGPRLHGDDGVFEVSP